MLMHKRLMENMPFLLAVEKSLEPIRMHLTVMQYCLVETMHPEIIKCIDIAGKFNAYQRVYVISGREPDFLNYLYYVITFWLGHLKKNSQGTTTRFIKLGQVTGMLVPVPPCAEQKHIIQTIQLLLNECDHLQ